MAHQRFTSWIAFFFSLWLHAAWAQPLPVDQAFRVSTQLVDHVLKVHWQLGPQTFLYADSLRFSSPTLQHGTLLKRNPETLMRHGQTFTVYAHHLTVGIPLIVSKHRPTHEATLAFQGCTRDGYCYPPQRLHYRLDVAHHHVISMIQTDATTLPHLSHPPTTHKLWALLLSFFTMGLLTAFTPCVWPMLPVLMKLLLGPQKTQAHQHSLRLSLCYVFGMAAGFALLGALFQRLGSHWQLRLQTPWVLGGYAVLLLVMGWSMLSSQAWPWLSRWTRSLDSLLQRLPQGRASSAAALGLASALVGSPCVTPPLVAGLALASQHHTMHAVLALGSMGLGMGMPLLILATTLGRLLPTSGPWLAKVKQVIGLTLIAAGLMFAYKAWPQASQKTTMPTVRTASQWSSILKQAQMHHQPLIVDVYAQWCINCLTISRWLSSPDYLARLKPWRVIRLDITPMTPELQTWLRQYHVIAPPTLLFLNAQGKALAPPMIGQAITAQGLLEHIQHIQR